MQIPGTMKNFTSKSLQSCKKLEYSRYFEHRFYVGISKCEFVLDYRCTCLVG